MKDTGSTLNQHYFIYNYCLRNTRLNCHLSLSVTFEFLLQLWYPIGFVCLQENMMFQVWHGPKKGEPNLAFPRNLNVLYVPQNTEKIKFIHFLILISNTMYYNFHLKFVEALQFISASPAPLFHFL